MNPMKFKAAAAALLLCISLAGGCASDEGTPSDPNVQSVQPAVKKSKKDVVFSHTSGFYNSDITLEMSCGTDGAEIYYTTDGSVPDETDTLYSEPILLTDKTSQPNVLSAQYGTSASGDFIPAFNVKKANVIRAIAVLPDGTKSDVLNGTFWIGINRQREYGDVPVISLMTEMDNLYDYEKGIYILGKAYDDWKNSGNTGYYQAWQAIGNYSGKGREWERPVAVEFITSDGTMGFMQDMGFRIMGAASRNATQKSFRFTAREEYGLKAVEYQILPDNTRSDGEGNVEKYKSFILRNGGNDCDYAKIRDPLIQALAQGGRYDTMESMPCVVYLNGEYWGMYTLAEDYNDNYIENNYGIDNNNVVIVKRGEIEDGNEEDIELYEEMCEFIVSSDMSDSENYEKAKAMIDVGSFADYCALNLYVYNQDSMFKDNNWQMWRARTPDDTSEYADGKWRMMVYDTDYSTGIYDGGGNYSANNVTEALRYSVKAKRDGSHNPAAIFGALYENEDFRKEFATAMCNMRNIYFEQERAVGLTREMGEVYKQLVPATFDRFGPDWLTWNTSQYYSEKLAELEKFMENRYNAFPRIIQKGLELNAYANASVSSSDYGKGTVKIGAAELDLSKEFTGVYFPDYALTVTAVPANGAVFKGWECNGCVISDSTSVTAEITFSGDFSIRAVFE